MDFYITFGCMEWERRREKKSWDRERKKKGESKYFSIRGERAKDITDHLPFNGAIHTDMIGFTGGLWLLWNSDKWKLLL